MLPLFMQPAIGANEFLADLAPNKTPLAITKATNS